MQSNKKKIGIVGWNTGDNSFGVTKAYMAFLASFGIVCILSPEEDIRTDLDLLVLPGGKDVDPTRYGHAPNFYNSDSNQMLEYFDKFKLPGYIEAGVPIFGICRGFQSLNVIFGGNLTQHYIHAYSKDRNELVHEVVICDDKVKVRVETNKGTKLLTKFKTNSLHHQCVFPEDLGAGLIPTLTTADGVIEGLRHSTLPIMGVQYHPEEIYDDYVIECINYLLNYKPTTNPSQELKLIKEAA